MRTLAVLTLLLALAACEAEAPEIDTLAPGQGSDPAADLVPPDDALAATGPRVRPDAVGAADGAAETVRPAGVSVEGPRVRAILPDGRVVLLGADDLMPGRFQARSSRFRINAVVWAGE